MKNKLLKAQMRGQWIDMQKTRGGIPARLKCMPSSLVAYRNMLQLNGIPYVIGQTGWTKCSNPKPIENIYVHCTDAHIAGRIADFCNSCDSWLRNVNICSFDLASRIQYRQDAIDNQRWHDFKLTPKYKKIYSKMI
jgi:hypothetical protein